MRLANLIPLSVFKKRTMECLVDIDRTNEPLVITLHGRGAFIVHRIDSYLRIEELADQAQQQFALDSVFQRVEEESMHSVLSA